MGESEGDSANRPTGGSAIIEAGGAAAGAAIGLALGGPLGALVGAATGPIAAFGVKHFSMLYRRYYAGVVAGLEQREVSESEFLSEIERGEVKRSALAALLRAASDVSDARQIDFLATATVSLIDADERASVAIRELASVASSLTPLQLNVLKFILDNAKSDPVTPDQILDHFAFETPLIRAAVRNLEHFGLIVDEARLDPDLRGVFWKVTEFGEWIVKIWQASSPPASEPVIVNGES